MRDLDAVLGKQAIGAASGQPEIAMTGRPDRAAAYGWPASMPTASAQDISARPFWSSRYGDLVRELPQVRRSRAGVDERLGLFGIAAVSVMFTSRW